MKNNGQTTENNRDSGILSSPISFLHSGRYTWDNATLHDRGAFSLYELSRSNNTTNSNLLYTGYTYLETQAQINRGHGFAARFQILHHSH